MLLLIMIKHAQADSLRGQLADACSIIQAIILAFFVLSCLAVGFQTCLNNLGIVFEAACIMVSIIDCLTVGRPYSYYSSLLIFRVTLYLREFIRSKTYQIAIHFWQSLTSILGYFLIVMVMTVVVHAQIGWFIFQELDIESVRRGYLSRFPFSDFKQSLYTSVMILFGNNWIFIYYKAISRYGNWAFLYFFCFTTLVGQIIFNIVLAMLLENMKRLFEKLRADKKKNNVRKLERVKIKLGMHSPRWKRIKAFSNLPAVRKEGVREKPKAGEAGAQQDILPELSFQNKTSLLQTSKIILRAKTGSSSGKVLSKNSLRSPALSNHSSSVKEEARRHSHVATPIDRPNMLNPPRVSLDASSVSRDSFKHVGPNIGSLPVLQIVQASEEPLMTEEEDQATHRALLPEPLASKKNAVSRILPSNKIFPSPSKALTSKARQQAPRGYSFGEFMSLQQVSGKFAESTPAEATGWDRRKQSSCFLLHRTSSLRKKLQTVVESKGFEIAVAAVIIINAVCLIIDSPFSQQSELRDLTLRAVDIVVNIFFILDLGMKILAYGGFIGDPTGSLPYFRRPVNLIDFALLITCWTSIYFDDRIRYLRSMKALRVMRLLGPLNNLLQSMTLRLIVTTAVGALSKTAVFSVFMFLCLFPYALIGMDNYPGKFKSCRFYAPEVSYLPYECRDSAQGETVTWSVGFYNIGSALLSSFVVATAGGAKTHLPFIMVKFGTAEVSYLLIAITFLAYLVMSLFLQNMIACLTILNFLEMKQTLEWTGNLNYQEHRNFDLQKLFIRRGLTMSKMRKYKISGGLLSTVVGSFWFDLCLFLTLALNIAFVILTGADDSIVTIAVLQLGILALYNCEIILKIYAGGLGYYINDNFNILDSSSTLLSDLLALLYFTTDVKLYFMLPTLSRILTFGRFLRRAIKVDHMITRNLKSMFDALQIATVSLFPMICVILLFIATFAIISMNVFHRIPSGNDINAVYNFRDFPSSVLTLLRLITGNHWISLLTGMSESRPDCTSGQTREEMNVQGPRRCGQPFAYFFVIFYLLVGKFILMNLITVLVIDGYFESKKLGQLNLTEETINQVIDTWLEYDTNKTGLMTCDNFILFLHDVEQPFGVKSLSEPRFIKPAQIVNKFIYRADLKIVVTIKDLLHTVREFPLCVYEQNKECYIHFVDYINFIANKIFPNNQLPVRSTLLPVNPGFGQAATKPFIHNRLTEQWNIKFPCKPQMTNRLQNSPQETRLPG